MKTFYKLIITILVLNQTAWAKDFVSIAIIDSGIHLSHLALKNHLLINKGETGKDAQGNNKDSNGIDDDNNGFIDDVHGWDFTENSNNPIDTNGHGTHIAGIILGVEPGRQNPISKLKILPLKYFATGANGQLNLLRSVDALKYAIDRNVDIINYSGGGGSADPREEALLRLAASKGILIVSAAGNFGRNLKFHQFYPASYSIRTLFAVAALDKKGRLMRESNYGDKVDFLALGQNVVSTLPNKKFGPMSGTSQATAIVTRRFALSILSSPSLKTNLPQLENSISTARNQNAEMNLKLPAARVLAAVSKLP